MPQYLAALTIVLMIAMVLTRAVLMKRQGIAAIKFGEIDKTDFVIPPFALFYFYLIFANTFGLPAVSTEKLLHSAVVDWIGVGLCFAGLSFLVWSLISFGKSFRIGIDTNRPDKLVTDGIFAHSRNPIYVAFVLILIGQFLIFPNWILLVYVFAGFWLFHRQVLREEDYLSRRYGEEYAQYRERVRRYF